ITSRVRTLKKYAIREPLRYLGGVQKTFDSSFLVSSGLKKTDLPCLGYKRPGKGSCFLIIHGKRKRSQMSAKTNPLKILKNRIKTGIIWSIVNSAMK
ncbi:MAG: hypothetical protein J5988_11630, partial [Eubacterium sp.]|nr:hypothetical protein [Eubacterium sp.]